MNKKLGVLMLNTVFPRLIGDIGRKETFNCSVEYALVEGATSHSVVMSDEDLCSQFIESALKLQDKGCSVISTSCGFLIKYQERIASALEVPFFSSSLLFLGRLEKQYANTVGILTADKNRLLINNPHLAQRTVCGIEGTYFYHVYVGNAVTNEHDLDKGQLYADLLNASKKLGRVNAILLECTNMSPFRDNLAQALSVPVYDIVTSLETLYGL